MASRRKGGRAEQSESGGADPRMYTPFPAKAINSEYSSGIQVNTREGVLNVL